MKEKILNEFIDELKKNKRIKSIIQIGSSLWDEKSKDIDIILIIEGSVPTFDDMEFLSKIKKEFSKKYDVVFGKGGIIEEIRAFNIDMIIIPEDYEVLYSFNPLLVYGMSLNPNKVLHGSNFFEKIKLKPDKEMLFKFGGPLSNFYLSFILGFDDLTPKNSKPILSMLKIILYPLVFVKGKHVKKKELIQFLKDTYPFFSNLCKKYNIKNNIFYKEKLSSKEIENIYNFVSELVENIKDKS